MYTTKDDIYKLLYDAVKKRGTLKEPFSAKDVRRTIPGWQYPRYFTYLAENCNESLTDGTALFVRVGRGRYRLEERQRQITSRPIALPDASSTNDNSSEFTYYADI